MVRTPLIPPNRRVRRRPSEPISARQRQRAELPEIQKLTKKEFFETRAGLLTSTVFRPYPAAVAILLEESAVTSKLAKEQIEFELNWGYTTACLSDVLINTSH